MKIIKISLICLSILFFSSTSLSYHQYIPKYTIYECNFDCLESKIILQALSEMIEGRLGDRIWRPRILSKLLRIRKKALYVHKRCCRST